MAAAPQIFHTFGELARLINPIIAGWMQYGRFYPSALYPLLARINAYLVRWIRNKHRRYDRTRAARAISVTSPRVTRGSSGTGNGSPPPGEQDDKSPVTGDCHAGICGSRGLKRPRLPDPAPGNLSGELFGNDATIYRAGRAMRLGGQDA